jgi:hypothetical protein
MAFDLSLIEAKERMSDIWEDAEIVSCALFHFAQKITSQSSRL